MLLKCRSLHALKFAFVSKLEAMHHLALENMKNLKVKNYNLSFFLLTFDYLWRSPKTFIIRTKYRQQGNCFRVFESESFQRHLWRSFIDNITLSQPRSFFFFTCMCSKSVFFFVGRFKFVWWRITGSCYISGPYSRDCTNSFPYSTCELCS